MKKYGLGVFAGSVLLATSVSGVLASEGIYNLTNRVGEDARCFAFAELMPDQNFKILVSCRDIIYPGGTEVFNYVVWATPVSGGNPTRLGTLDLGKVELRSKTAFGGLFVTKEKTENPRSPEGETIMQGAWEPVPLLEDRRQNVSSRPDSELGETLVTPSPSPAPKKRANIFQLGGIAAFIGLFLTMLLVFVITRK